MAADRALLPSQNTSADTIARSVVAPLQLPVGVLTALIGVPVFLWILGRR